MKIYHEKPGLRYSWVNKVKYEPYYFHKTISPTTNAFSITYKCRETMPEHEIKNDTIP